MTKAMLLSVAAVGLTACSGLHSGVPVVAAGPRADISPGGSTRPVKEATLTAGRKGAYVALLPQGTLTVDLEANTAAGYHWKLARPLDENVLKLVSSPERLPAVALAPTGPTRTEIEKWVFQAVGPGTQKVTLSYSRPDQPLNRSVIYDFTVNAE